MIVGIFKKGKATLYDLLNTSEKTITGTTQAGESNNVANRGVAPVQSNSTTPGAESQVAQSIRQIIINEERDCLTIFFF